MSLEGLRAWIGEVERKLGKRTRVFLALAVIAIGLAGAAIYLAIDARESSVSEGDVQALQEKLETRINEVAAGAPASTTTPTEAKEAIAPKPETETAPTPQSESGNGAESGGAGSADSKSSSGATTPPSGATGDAAGSAKLQKLVEEAERKNAEAEAANKGGK